MAGGTRILYLFTTLVYLSTYSCASALEGVRLKLWIWIEFNLTQHTNQWTNLCKYMNWKCDKLGCVSKNNFIYSHPLASSHSHTRATSLRVRATTCCLWGTCSPEAVLYVTSQDSWKSPTIVLLYAPATDFLLHHLAPEQVTLTYSQCFADIK